MPPQKAGRKHVPEDGQGEPLCSWVHSILGPIDILLWRGEVNIDRSPFLEAGDAPGHQAQENGVAVLPLYKRYHDLLPALVLDLDIDRAAHADLVALHSLDRSLPGGG